jgi:hypothetical protein
VAEEEHTLAMTLYFTHEVVLMLEATGFVDVELYAGYTELAPTGDDDFVVFVARKPIDLAGSGTPARVLRSV